MGITYSYSMLDWGGGGSNNQWELFIRCTRCVSYLNDPLAVCAVCVPLSVTEWLSECESQLCIEYTHEYRVICILNEANVTAGQVTNKQGREWWRGKGVSLAKQKTGARRERGSGVCKMNYKLRWLLKIIIKYLPWLSSKTKAKLLNI